MKKYDVIVVGAGVTGLLSALVLAKHGKKVLILEKSKHIGGNCNSYVVDGFQVDTGPHAITHLLEGPLKRIMDSYFDYIPVFEDYGNYFVRTDKRLVKVPSNIKEFVTFDVLPRMDRLALSQAVTKALTYTTFGMDLSKQSVYEFLPKNLSKDTYDFADTISYFLSGKDMKHTSAKRVLEGSAFVRDSVTPEQLEEILKTDEKNGHEEKVLQNLIPLNLHTSLQTRLNRVSSPLTTLGRLATNKVNYSQGYPRKGLKSLLNAILYSLPKTVEIMVENPVHKILVEEGVVKGVVADDTYLADIVVHTGFAKDLPRLVEELPSFYVKELDGIEQTKSLTIWIGLDNIMEAFNYIGSEIWFKEKAYWAMPISNYDSSLAPEGKQLVGFSFIMDSEKDNSSEIKKAYETIYNAVPGVEEHAEMKHEQIIIPEKAAVTIDGNFADIRTPIKNLYVAGTDTDRRSMGITRASYSVIEMLRVLNTDGNLHRRGGKNSSP
ncbi:NAD(P)/FAD-dependent oxidoreductase [uncultured Methanomethylovorans sp.]|uniref:phytoene desaturase family protein n=1 Tax=uncultured Methanomethylovorans sp. TaxID=183759 RepID=UPI002AA5EF3F|nr:NAD(P)/FAD-dependent oxidoreductase [uncultured Methanomethylovorans sp.]